MDGLSNNTTQDSLTRAVFDLFKPDRLDNEAAARWFQELAIESGWARTDVTAFLHAMLATYDYYPRGRGWTRA